MTKSSVPTVAFRKLTREGVEDLYKMIQTCRPHDSKMEAQFVRDFILPLDVQADAFGNLYKRVGTSPVMWASHLDTVHSVGGTQLVERDDKYIIRLSKKSVSNCLGADDTAGVWLMREMILARTPGLYVFHRGEEVGCVGSKWAVKNNAKAFADVKCVVSLDRRDNDSVITFQHGSRCCSNDFGTSMANELNKLAWDGVSFKYKNDPSGVWTDSAQYVDLIGECTNLSVGYWAQHTSREALDMDHLLCLREALIRMDQSKLVHKRQPGEKESRYQSYTGHNYYGSWTADEEFFDSKGTKVTFNHPEYYTCSYKSGYWGKTKKGFGSWVSLTREEWEIWRVEEWKRLGLSKPSTKPLAVTTSHSSGAVTSELMPEDDLPLGPIKKDDKDDFLNMFRLVKDHAIRVTRLLQSYGFDATLLKDTLWEEEFDSEKTTELTKKSEGKDDKNKQPTQPDDPGVAPTIQ